MNQRWIQERVEDLRSMSRETRAKLVGLMSTKLGNPTIPPEEQLEMARILLGLDQNDQRAAEIVQRYAHLDRDDEGDQPKESDRCEMDQELEARKKLKQCGGFDELYCVIMEFTGYRHREDGEVQRVSVQILDMGTERPELRYHVKAVGEDGKIATGNAAESIATAILITHWQALDV